MTPASKSLVPITCSSLTCCVTAGKALGVVLDPLVSGPQTNGKIPSWPAHTWLQDTSHPSHSRQTRACEVWTLEAPINQMWCRSYDLNYLFLYRKPDNWLSSLSVRHIISHVWVSEKVVQTALFANISFPSLSSVESWGLSFEGSGGDAARASVFTIYTRWRDWKPFRLWWVELNSNHDQIICFISINLFGLSERETKITFLLCTGGFISKVENKNILLEPGQWGFGLLGSFYTLRI